MAHGRDKNYVDNAIHQLQRINDKVHERKQVLNKFLSDMKQEMEASGDSLLMNTHYLYVGSSYERTAVTAQADFDIALILPRPFRADNFMLVEAHESGCFKLRSLVNDDDDIDEWTNSRDFLRVEDLKDYIFDELQCILERMEYTWTISYSARVSTLTINLEDEDGETLKIDIVPALRGFEMEKVPLHLSFNYLPWPLRGHYEYYLTLAAAPYLREMNDYHLLANISFAEMEKTCTHNSQQVLNAVHLAKLVSHGEGWKAEFGLRSFQIKRVALKHYNKLGQLRSNWDAYKYLMRCLSNDLWTGMIGGFFLWGQDVYAENEDTCKELAGKIDAALRSIQPKDLRRFFD